MFFLFFIAGRWLFHLSHFQGSLAPGFSLKWTPSAGAEQADWGWLTSWESVCLWLSGGSIWTLFPHHWDLGFQPHFSFPAAFYKWMVNPGSPGGSWFCIGNQSKVLFDFFKKKFPIAVKINKTSSKTTIYQGPGVSSDPEWQLEITLQVSGLQN